MKIKRTRFLNYLMKWIIYGIASATILSLIGMLCLQIEWIYQPLSLLIERMRVGYSEDNIYGAEISASFIMVSMVSLLSGEGDDILWENTVKYSLVNPRVINFISITVALIVNMIFSSFAFWKNDAFLFAIYFFTDISLLILMTYKMISAFFAKNSIRIGLSNKYIKMNDDEKESVCETLRDKCFLLTDNREMEDLDENIKFLNDNQCLDKLCEVLDYLSKVDEELFWYYVEEYNLSKEEKIRSIAHDVCVNLIMTHQNNELIKRIVNSIYNKETADELVDRITPQFNEFITFHSMENAMTMGKQGKQISNKLWYLWCETKDIKDREEKVSYFLSNYVKRDVEEFINKTYEEWRQENIVLPIDLLVISLAENNDFSFKSIIEYLEYVKNRFDRKIISDMKELDSTLFEKLNAWWEEDSDYDKYYTKYCEVDNWEINMDLLYNVVIPGYKMYKKYIHINFMGTASEYINNIIVHADKYITITDSLNHKLLDLVKPIVFEDNNVA